jgi:DNA invertase Pin-like site-specific DNA recombinase
MKAAAYTRVSSQGQIDGTSLDAQTAQIQAYASLKGIDLVHVFSDPGVSGGAPIVDRPQGAKLAKLLESGTIDAIIVVKLDRAFRNTVDCLQSVEEWRKYGVALHIIDLGGNSVDSESPAGKFMLTVLAAAGEMERGMINVRCNEGRRARKAQGYHIGGGVPFGYDLDEGTRQLVENPREQEITAMIHALKAEGFSYSGIATRLNAKGLTTKGGRAWTHKQVARVCRRAA